MCCCEFECRQLRFENFHGHGVTLCYDCYMRIWTSKGGKCYYCTKSFWLKCSSCKMEFPMTEMHPNWHGHRGVNLCIMCIQTQYARPDHFLCPLHGIERVFIPFAGHPLMGLRVKAIFRLGNAISQLLQQLALALSTYGYPQTAESLMMHVNWLIYSRNFTYKFG